MSDLGWGESPLLAFDNDEPEFVRGFELGRVWAILSETDCEFDCELHVTNAEMILRLAEATDRTVDAEMHDDVWLTARFSERGAA